MPAESSEDLNISFLVGGVLQQLALGLYEFQLVFHTESYISVEHTLRLEKTDMSLVEIRADKPEQSKELYFLLGRTVIDAQIGEPQVLEITFDDQSRVKISPTNNGYESYVIWNKNKYIAI